MNYKIIIENLVGHDMEGKIGKIYNKINDSVKKDDVILTIESGKGSVELLSKHNGKIEELNVKEGQTVRKGQEIGSVNSSQLQDENNSSAKQGYTFGIIKPNEENINADVAIIGGGPGGYIAAIRCAQNGKKTVLIEKDKLGGTCLNYGCIPTKAMISACDCINKSKIGEHFGISFEIKDISLSKIIDRKDKIVQTLVMGVKHLINANNIELIEGQAEINSENELVVKCGFSQKNIHFEKLILACGSIINEISFKGNNPKIYSSNDLLQLREIPESLSIIGGGIIGMEFAFIYNSLGCHVNVIECAETILRDIDEEVIEVIKKSAKEKGISIYENTCVNSINKTMDGEIVIEVEKDNMKQYIVSKKVATAAGRKPFLHSVNLEILKVEIDSETKGIKVDNHMRTTNKDIYAIGDITNIYQLAHVASFQGLVAADNIAGINAEMEYSSIPSAIFTMPEIGQVGLTQKQAEKKGLDIIIRKFPFKASGKALAMGEIEGFVKLIADKKSNSIIGGIIVGAKATELIGIITNLISQKTKIENAQKVIYAHPTLSEGIFEALLMLNDRGLHFV